MANRRNRKRHGSNSKYRGSSCQAKKAKIQADVPDVPSDTAVDTDVTGETSSQNCHDCESNNIQQQESATPHISASAPLSKSAKKVKVSSKKKQKKQHRRSLKARIQSPEGFRLIDMGQLSKALLNAHVCPGGSLELREDPDAKEGLCSTLYICCSVCCFGEPFRTSPFATNSKHVLDVNRRAALISVELGLGHQGLIDLSALFNMPAPNTKSTFSNHLHKIRNATHNVTEEDMSRAARNLRQQRLEEDPTLDQHEPIDVCVSFDGTWSKRGFTANHGIGVIIAMDTGEILDRHTLSKVCGSCLNRTSWDKSSQEYLNWYASHKTMCPMNYEGSSPSMETHAAGVMWKRSIAKHNLRYKYMVCDGDSKAFHEVEFTYGTNDDDKVVKLDCIGHVSKRMYRALEGVKKSHSGKLSDGKSIGGGAGRLTSTANGTISRLSDLYRNAIRQNSDKDIDMSDNSAVKKHVETMQDSIMAILYHETKLADDKERHKYCPENTPELASWCEFKRSGAMENKPHHLDPIFLDLLMPTFVRLSDAKLLARCLNGYTQNQNESFNALIWKRCPKHLWRGPGQIEIAVNLAVLHWNGGCQVARSETLESLGLPYGKYTQAASIAKDVKRVTVSMKRITDQDKRKRSALTKQRTLAEECKIKKEGKTYGNACFAGLAAAAVPADHWDSDDDLPLADEIPLALTTCKRKTSEE